MILRFRHFLCATLLCAAPLSAQTTVVTPVAPTTPTTPVAPTAADVAALSRYQLALDQALGGNPTAARVILEDGINRNGPRPELNLLLAYLLQREGKNDQARNRLAPVTAISPVAAAFTAQLQGPLGSTALAVPPIGTIPTTTTLPTVTTDPISTASIPKGTTLAQTDARLVKLELAMVDMVNDERAKAGLGLLKWDEKLASVARAHAAEMRDKNYFAHESPTPGMKDPLDRYRVVFQDSPRVIAENIFRSWGAQRQVSLDQVKEGHESLMNSPGHRANILYREVTHIGIGFAVNSHGDLWITQMFMRP